MRRRGSRALGLACALAAGALVSLAHAQTTPDFPAALLVYPYLEIDSERGIDTWVQLSNVADEPADVRCFYERFEARCVNGGRGESCDPERKSFRLRLTPRQPVAWRASAGLSAFPLGGDATGPEGDSNEESEVPPLGGAAATATLRCVMFGSDSNEPAARNVLVGIATISRRPLVLDAQADALQYRAIGAHANADVLDADEILHLGGGEPEYAACPDVNLLDHYFGGAVLPSGDRTAEVATNLTLTPCTSPSEGVVAQFLVFNEFSQRFSTSRVVRPGQFAIPMTSIDTTQADRSIFSAGVAGTFGGRTQITGVGGGLHALAIETHTDRETGAVHSDAVQVHSYGVRLAGDAVVFRSSSCTGDCNFDGTVAIHEIIASVGIGSGAMPVARCAAADRDHDGQVAIDEMVSSVGAALDGCAAIGPPPTPTMAPIRTPTAGPTGEGPEVTHFGLAGADDIPLPINRVDEEGRPLYVRPFGQGFTLLVEGRRGNNGRQLARDTYDSAGGAPDLQVLASRDLGDGDPTVCEQNGTRGGVPATPNLDFGDPYNVPAMNDLGCRAFDLMPGPESTCTRVPPGRPFGFVGSGSELQFCIPVARAWALPAGDTIFAARVSDNAGNFSTAKEIVVRVTDGP